MFKRLRKFTAILLLLALGAIQAHTLVHTHHHAADKDDDCEICSLALAPLPAITSQAVELPSLPLCFAVPEVRLPSSPDFFQALPKPQRGPPCFS